MAHNLAAIWGIFSGSISTMRTGYFSGLIATTLCFVVGFKFTMTATIPFGFIRTHDSPFVKNSLVLLEWSVVTLIGIRLIVVPLL